MTISQAPLPAELLTVNVLPFDEFATGELLRGDPACSYKAIAVEAQAPIDPDATVDTVVYMTTDRVDSDNEVLIPSGCDLTRFNKNPILLLCHPQSQPVCYYPLPVGGVRWTKVRPRGVMGGLAFSRGTRMGREVKALWDEGHLRTVSVGFLPIEASPMTRLEAESRSDWREAYERAGGQIKVHRRWLLVELSIAPIPANEDAVKVKYKSMGVQPPSWLALPSLCEAPMSDHEPASSAPETLSPGFKGSGLNSDTTLLAELLEDLPSLDADSPILGKCDDTDPSCHDGEATKDDTDAMTDDEDADLPAKSAMLKAVRRCAKSIRHCGEYGHAFYHHGKRMVHHVMSPYDHDDDDFDQPDEIRRKYKKIRGIKKVRVEDEYAPPDDDEWDLAHDPGRGRRKDLSEGDGPSGGYATQPDDGDDSDDDLEPTPSGRDPRPHDFVRINAPHHKGVGQVASLHDRGLVPDVKEDIRGTRDDDAARVRCYKAMSDGHVPTTEHVGVKCKHLQTIAPLKPPTAVAEDNKAASIIRGLPPLVGKSERELFEEALGKLDELLRPETVQQMVRTEIERITGAV